MRYVIGSCISDYTLFCIVLLWVTIITRHQAVNCIDAFGVTYHFIQSWLKIDVTPIITYAVTPIGWQKRANHIDVRPQQLRRAYQVQLQQNFPSRTFLEPVYMRLIQGSV